MKLALAQINPTVGDFPGNIRKIVDTTRAADDCGADLVIFPELAICGYFPADLLEKRSFLERTQDALHRVAEQATEGRKISVLCGCVTAAAEATGKRVMNSAALLRRGRIDFVQSKMLLPYYDVFDEQRYFAPASSQSVFGLAGERLGITICEDAWNDKDFWPQRLYPMDPVESLMQQGATLILNISASPFSRGKRETRQKMLTALARRHKVTVVMVNQIGGNDSLIFDGSSLAIDAQGNCIGRAKSFHEDLVIVDTSASKARPVEQSSVAEEGEDAAIYQALVLGTRDYVRKCGFSKVIVGLSGGIDSALVACLAVEALGSENVLGVGMPSEYSSPGSVEDARQLACNLGIEWRLIPIRSMFRAHLEALRPLLNPSAEDVTEENLQSRIRGALLMALSNNRSALVLTTGNKSEMSTGYCTLYGDMVGALAVIGDVYKTLVYGLAAYVNREQEVIPKSTLTKPPSAELRPGQQDTDCLPPYDVLDPILEAYVEHYATAEMIVEASSSNASGTLDMELVRSVVRMVEKSEYKRQQAAPVLKVTQKSFGSGRRFPIAVQVRI
ncbi:MAG TPA: NAD+ synthase [Acidobacteriaceae bacterium]|nr:NAD+ synthase [Acidobacteriaceae bacterium]